MCVYQIICEYLYLLLDILTFFRIINNSAIKFFSHLTVNRVSHDFKIKFHRKTMSPNFCLNCNVSANI